MENSKHALFQLDDGPDVASTSTTTVNIGQLNLFTIDKLQKQIQPQSSQSAESAESAQSSQSPKIDITTTPILLVRQEPKASSVVENIDSFTKSGLVEGDLTAVNGPAMTIILSNVGNSGSLKDKLYMIPSSPKYTSIQQIPAKQVCFLTLFHHLHFLATFHSASGTPTFTDSLREKFEFLKNNLNDTDLKPFGINAKEEKNPLAVFWESLQKNTKDKISLQEIIQIIKGGPKEVYKYMTVDGETATATDSTATATAAPVLPTSSSPAPSAPPAEAKPADEKADEKKPADEKAGEKKPTDEKADEKKPADEKAEAKPTDEKKPNEAKPADKKPDPIPNSETVYDERASQAPTFSPSETTEQGLAGYPKPNGTVASETTNKFQVGARMLYGKTKTLVEITKIHDNGTFNIKKVKGTPDAGHEYFSIDKKDLSPALNSISESNSNDENNTDSNSTGSTGSTVAVSSANYQSQRGSIQGENKTGKPLSQGASVYLKDDKTKTYAVSRVLGTKETPRKNRKMLLRDAKGKEFTATSKDLEYTEEGLRRSTRVKQKTEGGFRFTRKKNRKIE